MPKYPGYKHPSAAVRRMMARDAERAFRPFGDALFDLFFKLPATFLFMIFKVPFVFIFKLFKFFCWDILLLPFKILFGRK